VPEYITTTGDAYALREQGQELRRLFGRDHMEPALAKLLGDASWAGWVAGLDKMPDMARALDEWLAAFDAWQEHVAKRREERLLEQSEAGEQAERLTAARRTCACI
jgi:hypothetical protein